ncbi:hypothetical protein H5410_001403 [Solanum commersonii]|uniref:Uncharacterized protein n=1 Tax=Solanum commersonii TaxID=4109 RepID=A0A9J6AYU8_SOLCO|nr:hypothetical protein H5410_001403 [Solanum commersonii]
MELGTDEESVDAGTDGVADAMANCTPVGCPDCTTNANCAVANAAASCFHQTMKTSFTFNFITKKHICACFNEKNHNATNIKTDFYGKILWKSRYDQIREKIYQLTLNGQRDSGEHVRGIFSSCTISTRAKVCTMFDKGKVEFTDYTQYMVQVFLCYLDS